MTARTDFRFTHRLRVRWAEVDMQKIVFNGHYLAYADTAVAEYWRALALPYEATMHAMGGDLYVRKASLEYHASAHYDEVLDVCLRCARIGNSSITFALAIFHADRRLITGELVYVFADPSTQTAQPVPAALREVFEAYERGEDMVRIEQGDWATLGGPAGAVRTAVFVQEQGIPAELEWDEADATALHAVAFNRLGLPLGTGRLLAYQPGVVKIGRMAVCLPMRGGQVGRQLLTGLMQAARARGEREVVLHAQRSAEAFYARNGYVPQGAPFEEAGIAHIEMACRL